MKKIWWMLIISVILFAVFSVWFYDYFGLGGDTIIDPIRCKFEAPIQCADYRLIPNGTVKLALQNYGDVTLENIEIEIMEENEACVSDSTAWESGKVKIFICHGEPGERGTRTTVKFNIKKGKDVFANGIIERGVYI